jgi:hypothetical protein
MLHEIPFEMMGNEQMRNYLFRNREMQTTSVGKLISAGFAPTLKLFDKPRILHNTASSITLIQERLCPSLAPERNVALSRPELNIMAVHSLARP